MALSTATSAISATYVPASMPQATPTPRPLGAAFGVQPNFSAAAFSTRIMRASARFFRRNSTGSMPAFAAMMSMCDSRAKALVLAPGARHGPTANG